MVRQQRDPTEHMAARITVFSLMLVLAPVLALVWVRYVWQEANAPGVSWVALLSRTGLIAAAGLLAYVVLRLVGAAVSAVAHALEVLDRRRHPWRW
jgi:hypothetical protein